MKFVLDRPLGRLCKWLRILGYDAAYWRGEVEGAVEFATRTDRILLTKSLSTFEKAKGKCKVFLVQGNDIHEQLGQVVKCLGLQVEEGRLFSRCLSCNEELLEVSPEEVKELVPDYIWKTHFTFSRCPRCKKVFWAGSHYERMKETLRGLGI